MTWRIIQGNMTMTCKEVGHENPVLDFCIHVGYNMWVNDSLGKTMVLPNGERPDESTFTERFVNSASGLVNGSGAVGWSSEKPEGWGLVEETGAEFWSARPPESVKKRSRNEN